MAPPRAVRDDALPLLLDAVVRERLAAGVLAEPDALGRAVAEQDRVVLPVAHVVAGRRAEDHVAVVERVEVHVEREHGAVAVVAHDDRRGGLPG